jgi:uncharacterized damage-inducible protein DinB
MPVPEYTRPAADEYHPAYQNYIDLVPVGVIDILQLLKKQGLEVLTLMRTLNDEQAEYRYQPKKWSVKEVVGHLIDTERLFAFRALWAARGEPNEQAGMDEELWGRNSNAHTRPLADLWREQHVCRTDHVYLLRSLAQEDLGRKGFANGSVMTARSIPWLIAGHEKHHMNVLKEIYDVG